MRLPRDILTNTFTTPDVYLCETDKTIICKLDVSNMQASLKFNAYSELSFEVGRTYNDDFTGETKVNPFYDKIEALRLIYLDGFGYFEIQGPELTGDGIKESKSITAYSLEYTLSQKYLEDFYVNTGEVNSVEVINASSNSSIVPVTLYNPVKGKEKLSLLHLILEKDYAGWKIGHVDPQLQTLSRQFEVDRESIYDFLMNEVCEKFNCYIVFDTDENKINVYAESPTAKFIGDGKTKTFYITNGGDPFDEIKTVSIDGYKTTKWSYSISNGVGTLVLDDIPVAGAMIEVVGVDSTWESDVFVTFDNLSNEVKVNYDADSIKTVLTVTYGDDNDIREVNLGLPYITDLSYYCTPEWLGQDLYEKWIAYQEKCNNNQSDYTYNAQQMLYYAGQIDYEENRLSLGYAEINVDENSVGTYYVRGGTYPNYYYTEVSLPSEYNVNTTYYSTKTTNLEDGSEGNVALLYEALKKYFMYAEDWKSSMDALADKFKFMGDNVITDLSAKLAKTTANRISVTSIENTLAQFFATMWNELGRTPLKQMFYEPYKKVQITNMEAGWSKKDDAEYGNYYTVVLLLGSLEQALSERDKKIKQHESAYNTFVERNKTISDKLLIDSNFTKGELLRLNAFLREDELHLDDIITTDQDSVADTYKNQQDALEAGRIELSKLARPQLQFNMSMANIYALPEFEPIIDQFQLGSMIKVAIRPDYIQQARLLQVNINFEDFSDFSCEFGELTNVRTQSDIHADLLKNAISAGKSVAQNASYWTKGSDQANSIDLRLQEGLLDAATAIKSIDGLQEVSVDNYGIHLRKKIADGEGYEDKQGWIVNNQFLYSDDAFKTTKAVLGEYKIPKKYNPNTQEMEYEKLWGLLAEAVVAGYVEGSSIIGGTIKIGEYIDDDGELRYAFEVHEDGSVTMNGGTSIDGYLKEDDVSKLIRGVDTMIIGNEEPTNPKEGQLWLKTLSEPYVLMLYENGQWSDFSQQSGQAVYTARPTSYSKGDLWIVAENDVYNSCQPIDGKASICVENVLTNTDKTYYTKYGSEIEIMNYVYTDSIGYPVLQDDTVIVGYEVRITLGVIATAGKPAQESAIGLYNQILKGDPFVFQLDTEITNPYNTAIPIDSITIDCRHVDDDGFTQKNVKYYGVDKYVNIEPEQAANMCIICSGGNIYIAGEEETNQFVCEKPDTKFVNGKILKAIDSSSVFSYDHWVDANPEETETQNNIYNTFKFNKETGLTIGQTDSKFYVNIDSQEMGFYDNSAGQNQKVVHISNSTANIDNMEVDGSAQFNCNTTFNQQVSLFGFTFKKETNGSLSLVAGS